MADKCENDLYHGDEDQVDKWPYDDVDNDPEIEPKCEVLECPRLQHPMSPTNNCTLHSWEALVEQMHEGGDSIESQAEVAKWRKILIKENAREL